MIIKIKLAPALEAGRFPGLTYLGKAHFCLFLFVLILAQAGLELTAIPLPQPLQCQDYRPEPLYMAAILDLALLYRAAQQAQASPPCDFLPMSMSCMSARPAPRRNRGRGAVGIECQPSRGPMDNKEL